jgi:hypothetical protein
MSDGGDSKLNEGVQQEATMLASQVAGQISAKLQQARCLQETQNPSQLHNKWHPANCRYLASHCQCMFERTSAAVVLTVTQATERGADLCSCPALRARQAGDGTPIICADKVLAVQALGAVPNNVELPELAGWHLAHVQLVVAGAVVALWCSQTRLAGQAGPEAVEGRGVGGACARLGSSASSSGKDVASLGNCRRSSSSNSSGGNNVSANLLEVRNYDKDR